MLKTLFVAIVMLVSSLSYAEGEETGVMRMPSTDKVSCRAQILIKLQIPDEVVDDMDVSNNTPTEEYTDYLVQTVLDNTLVLATMRCYTDGRPMERVF